MPVGAISRDEHSAEFFDGTQRGELLLRHCLDCGHWNAPSALSCTACRSGVLEWLASTGAGQIISFGLVHPRGASPRIAVAVVELDEGPWLQTQLVGMDPDALGIGDRVTVSFEQPDGGEALPVFRLAAT
jgi:uncharacterized protein